MSRRRRRPVASPERLEPRIVLGYYSADPVDEQPLPIVPGTCPPPPIAKSNPPSNPGGPALTRDPIRAFDGSPVVSADDLPGASAPAGFSWGATRTWAGVNNSGPVGNGWSLGEAPYVIVAGGTNGTGIPGDPIGIGYGIAPGTAADDRIEVVAGGTNVYTFAVDSSGPTIAYVPYGDPLVKLELAPDPTPTLRLTDAAGNITDFYDVKRNASGTPVANSMAPDPSHKYGRFRSYSAPGGARVDATYDSGNYLASETLTDPSAAALERISFDYEAIPNGDPYYGRPDAILAHTITLERPDGSGGWRPAQRAVYDYYTGQIPDPSHEVTAVNDPNGRLGDLKSVRIEDASASGESVDWTQVDADYYRYDKFAGESDYTTSQGPTNDPNTTGGPDPAGPTGGADNMVFSGLRTVVMGRSLAVLDASVADYQSASDDDIRPYVNNFFRYERWSDHGGVDGTNGAYTNWGQSYDWRTSYRTGSRYRAVEELAQGAGCSCSTGQGDYKYEYAANYGSPGLGYSSIETNTWRMRTTAFLPANDPNWATHDRQVAYTNEVGQPILDVFVDVGDAARSISSISVSGSTATVSAAGHGFATGDRVALAGVLPEMYDGIYAVTRVDADTFTFTLPSTIRGVYAGSYPTPLLSSGGAYATAVLGEWATYSRYDAAGHLLLQAQPSAVGSYDESRADLLDDGAGNYPGLNASAGLIQTYAYAAATTATSTAAGDVAGYASAAYVQQGRSGTPIIQESWAYFSRDNGSGVTIYVPAADTTYGLDYGTAVDSSDRDPRTTTYAYAWYSGTTQPSVIAVALPVVAATQGGPGTADVEMTAYDALGRPTWSRDGDHYLTYTAYDAATGAVAKTIVDVDTSRTSEFSGLPSGWATPAGGGLHLVTQDQVDPLGRTTRRVSPAGRVTYWAYLDADHEVRTYPGWDASAATTTGPIRVDRQDWAGGYDESLAMAATPSFSGSSGSYAPTGGESIAAITSLSRTLLDLSNRHVEDDRYASLSSITYAATPRLGTAGTNYYPTSYAYDQRGRRDRVEDAAGTITDTIYDGLGRLVATYVGTDDSTATGWHWTPATAGPYSNMTLVSSDEYDSGGVGDGNLTRLTQYVDATSSHDRVTRYAYDWRDRLVAAKAGVQASEGTSTHRPIVYLDLDNLGEVTASSQFDGDGVAFSASRPGSSLLRAYVVTSYDDRGRVYLQQQYGVDPSAGTVSTYALTTATYYDHRGHAIATYAPGGLVTKDRYDGAGRLAVESSTDGYNGTTWADASSVAGDHVLAQTRTTYDADGDAILVATAERHHDAPGTSLGDLFAAGLTVARFSYRVSYYDPAGRLTASVDVGTDGGSAYTRPSSPPARSDVALVTTYQYDAAGRVDLMTDPRGIMAESDHDILGRTTRTVAGFAFSGPTATTPTVSTNQTTAYNYDGMDHVLTVTAVMPTGGTDQVTTYAYGVTLSGSGIASNDLLASLTQPDGTSATAYNYDRLGEAATATDPDGSVHAYAYDVLGRMTSDAVTTLGSGVDGAVRRIEVAYDTQGNPYLLTSYDAAAGGSVVNQVEDAFNGLGQLTAQYQSVSGAVSTSTTPKVQYAYAEMSGGQNNSRPISMTYPNGRVLDYTYASGLDSTISRLSSIADDASGNPGTVLESYAYLGLAKVVVAYRPQAGVALSYVMQAGDTAANADGGDEYTGLDRFGRVIDQDWVNTSTGASTARYQYSYDRAGDVLYRADLVESALSELYHANSSAAGDDATGYDPLGRLAGFARGVLSSSGHNGSGLDTVASPSVAQTWSLDALGNMAGVSRSGTTVTRGFNVLNQATSVSSGSAPTYDVDGNTLTDGAGLSYTYDAWNRLVAVRVTSTSAAVASYAYDATGRRVVESYSGGSTNYIYYSPDWHVVEERRGGTSTGHVHYQYATENTGRLVLRDTYSGGSIVPANRLYAEHDANGDVTAVTNSSGAVAERYAYSPYGEVTVMDPSGSAVTGNASVYEWRNLFQGGRMDVASGLYVFEHRNYDPTRGAWTTRDPLGLLAGNNIYQFSLSNPNKYNDPTGNLPIVVVPFIVGGLIGGNFWIWGNNCQVADDLINGNDINYNNTPYSYNYYYGLGTSTLIGGAVGAAPQALPGWASSTLIYGGSAYGVYQSSNSAWNNYNNGNYLTFGFDAFSAGGSLYGGYKWGNSSNRPWYLDPSQPQPNAAALKMLRSAPIRRGAKFGLECTFLAGDIGQAAGTGYNVSIMADMPNTRVWHVVGKYFGLKWTKCSSEHHQVYSDGNYAFDPMWSSNPIPWPQYQNYIVTINKPLPVNFHPSPISTEGF